MLRCENTRLELDRAPTAPAALDSPSPPQLPVQYEFLHGEQVRDLCLVADGYRGLPSQQEFPTQFVLLVEDHLHELGDTQNTPRDHPRVVEQCAHHSVESPPYRWLGR